ncbi:DUF6520 family protein [Epilithonimonas ginsengisoli]|uniref:DUF6520 family protein n=1 Tax=Epilithonimonas ginsengisoli TaxID=1245592 RepID=A0ABU4JK16_9FLAO|nr:MULTISPECIES: DUF6520 family protein [Chryseobacterium group]MBV6880458.1 hypothetical protein [Epilithonimonas sp. FP105]MDW8550025.1 DUF6520 family protein [Epilithonimonas ginsengisoli]OAH69205.1 hypothetical protein AXA65_15380 [Chryseobacterium sp. FP211-J200]
MKKVMISAVVILFGTGAAFATNYKSTKAIFTGYRLVNSGGELQCEPDKNCTDVDTGAICTWSSDNATPLHRLESPSMCVQTLYEINP